MRAVQYSTVQYSTIILKLNDLQYIYFVAVSSTAANAHMVALDKVDSLVQSSTAQGAVFVYTTTAGSGVWSQAAELFASDGTSFAQFGFCVSVNQDSHSILVGSPAAGERDNLCHLFFYLIETKFHCSVFDDLNCPFYLFLPLYVIIFYYSVLCSFFLCLISWWPGSRLCVQSYFYILWMV